MEGRRQTPFAVRLLSPADTRVALGRAWDSGAQHSGDPSLSYNGTAWPSGWQLGLQPGGLGWNAGRPHFAAV